MNTKRAGSGSTQHRDDSEGTREAVKKISNNTTETRHSPTRQKNTARDTRQT